MKYPGPLQKALEEAKKMSGLSYKEIADKAGITSHYTSLLAQGERMGSGKTWRAIAAVFGYNYQEFREIGELLLDGYAYNDAAVSSSPYDGLKNIDDDLYQIYLKKNEYPSLEILFKIIAKDLKNNTREENMVQRIIDVMTSYIRSH